METLEAVRRIRLETSNSRNSRNPRQRAAPPDRIQEQRHEHAHHFVDDDDARIGASEVTLGDGCALQTPTTNTATMATPARRPTAGRTTQSSSPAAEPNVPGATGT